MFINKVNGLNIFNVNVRQRANEERQSRSGTTVKWPTLSYLTEFLMSGIKR